MSSDLKSSRKDGGVEAPIGLGGLFSTGNDGDDDETFENQYELQTLTICDTKIQVRQYSWHEANANQVWPGTFILADFIRKNDGRYKDSNCLELGSATGALAIYLRLCGYKNIVTCDIDDQGLVADNVQYNTVLNGLSPNLHIAHTWGTGWQATLDKLSPADKDLLNSKTPFRFIIASDILLYVSAYGALVASLTELFQSGEIVEFVMSWNRRISASGEFFDMMRAAGFLCHHHGLCVYSFFLPAAAASDPFLAALDVKQDNIPTSK